MCWTAFISLFSYLNTRDDPSSLQASVVSSSAHGEEEGPCWLGQSQWQREQRGTLLLGSSACYTPPSKRARLILTKL